MAVKTILPKDWPITRSYDYRFYSTYPNGDKPIPSAWGSGGTDWYLSPTGNDANNGLSSGAPKKTFANVFAAMASGDQLYLMDGTYSEAAGTGIIHYDTAEFGVNSAQIPAGISLARSTRVKAVNDGLAIIDTGGSTDANAAAIFIGRTATAHNYIEVWGVKCVGGVTLHNGNYDSFKNVGCNGAFNVGTGDHSMGVTYNLIEDCWAWASAQRIIAINYRADYNTWRRFVFRGDGCSTAACIAAGAPNVGFTVYESTDVLCLNMIGVDCTLDAAAIAAGNTYADFATAQHSVGQDFGSNKWLGCMSVNSAHAGLWFEADATVGTTAWTVSNFTAVCNGNAYTGGTNIGSTGAAVISGLTVVNSGVTGDGIRVAPGSPGTSVTNVLVRGYNRGINSSLQASYTSVYGATTAYNQTTPTVGVFTANQFSDGTPASLKYPVRIESGSALKDAGLSGADIGSTIMYCYGASGARVGDAAVETLQADALWPYPNEARIKTEMAASSARGFCTGNSIGGTAQSLTKYIWEQLGNEIPADYYAGWAA